MSIGDRISELRSYLKMNLFDMADNLHTDWKIQENIETGRQLPDSYYLQSLSWLCDVDYNWLLTGKGDMILNRSVNHSEICDDSMITGILFFQDAILQKSEDLIKELCEDYQDNNNPKTIQNILNLQNKIVKMSRNITDELFHAQYMSIISADADE